MKSKSRLKLIVASLIMLIVLILVSLIFKSSHDNAVHDSYKKQEEIKDNTKQDYSDFGNVDAGGTD